MIDLNMSHTAKTSPFTASEVTGGLDISTLPTLEHARPLKILSLGWHPGTSC